MLCAFRSSISSLYCTVCVRACVRGNACKCIRMCILVCEREGWGTVWRPPFLCVLQVLTVYMCVNIPSPVLACAFD